MLLLTFYLLLALGVSFLCSIMEAVILSVTPSFVEALEERNPKTGASLRKLKEDIDKPLAAILSLNTIAHTVGAAGVGAQALEVFGSGYVAVTSAVLTFLILILSEIIPKTLGAYHWRKLAGPLAKFLPLLIKLLYPLVQLSKAIAKLLSKGKDEGTVNREELLAMTEIARREGVFRERESKIFNNLIAAEKLKVKDIITPRTILFTLPESLTIKELLEDFPEKRFSRIPLHGENPDNIKKYVLYKDILHKISEKKTETTLGEIGRELTVVPEIIPLTRLFENFLESRENIVLVVDEHGSVEGIATMEDLVETILGIEIVDETDPAYDMQELARRLWVKRSKKLGITDKEKEND